MEEETSGKPAGTVVFSAQPKPTETDRVSQQQRQRQTACATDLPSVAQAAFQTAATPAPANESLSQMNVR